MPVNDAFHIYDTTLRDGAQQEGLNLSVHDKLNIARHLDDLGCWLYRGWMAWSKSKRHRIFRTCQERVKAQERYLRGFRCNTTT